MFRTDRIKHPLSLLARRLLLVWLCLDVVQSANDNARRLEASVRWPPRTDISGTVSPVIPLAVALRGGGGDAPQDTRPIVLIIDVDNCLYSEKEARAASRNLCGVESQIVQNTHDFGLRHFNMTKDECDDLYRAHGSTVEGLRHTLDIEKNEMKDVLRTFYHEVYEGIDMSCLVPVRGDASADGHDDTGYSHAKTKRRHLTDLLKATPFPVYFASNSPRGHVQKVLTSMGLCDIGRRNILTPDSHMHDEDEPFASKSSPARFFRRILDRHPAAENRLILLDDSKLNLKRASEVGIEGLHVGDGQTLEEALAVGLGHIQTQTSDRRAAASEDDGSVYKFCDVRYLKNKNDVDSVSINESVWERLGEVLSLEAVPSLSDGILRVADVGAGLLSMLQMVLVGGGGKRSLLDMLRSNDAIASLKEVHYYAYEPNRNLLEECRDKLHKLGFVETEAMKSASGEEVDFLFHHQLGDSSKGEKVVHVTVHLKMKDFTQEAFHDFSPPDLIIGCCFADLFDPHELLQSLLRFTNACAVGGGLAETRKCTGTLVYFPITFSGTTQFYPPRPFGVIQGQGTVPSDTMAFKMYAKSLEEKHGHNLDPGSIIDAMKAHGGNLLASGKSDWSIDYAKQKYLWHTMMYFFGTSGAAELMINEWNSAGWIARAAKNRPQIMVSNVDLLFRLGPSDAPTDRIIGDVDSEYKNTQKSMLLVDEIQFQAPGQVGKVTKQIKSKHGKHLRPTQVEVQSVCSLISSGTELKVFKGMFNDAALDVNIKGMDEERMAYPLAYGYSLVGRVTRCGSKVKDADQLLGKLVFTFSPHASVVIAERDAIQVVPDGIAAEDAIFMPSVETALSLAHDAHVRIGERVAIYGQGLIGLLVTSLLGLQDIGPNTGQFGTITAFDMLSDRLAASSVMGASQALMPTEASEAGPFDVSIEVSGNARALQSAIDNTSSGGRIIVGSWYGNADVSLKLGIDFHRSHKTIKTSQVSEIPAELTALWSKDRRFALTWELVRKIRPSRLITRTSTLNEAQEAYELLDAGKEIAVAFKYNDSQ